MLNTWQKVVTPSEPLKVFAFKNSLYMVTKDKCFRQVDNAWVEQTALNCSDRYGYSVLPAENYWYAIQVGGRLSIIDPSSSAPKWQDVSSIVYRASNPATTCGDTFFCYIEKQGIVQYHPDSKWNNYFRYRDVHPLPSSNIGQIAATKEAIYFNCPWEAMDRHKANPQKPPKASGVVWQITDTHCTDITYNLDLNNQMGQPFGPGASLTCEGNGVYIATDQGVFFKANAAATSWSQINKTFGSSSLSAIAPNQLLASPNQVPSVAKIWNTTKGEWTSLNGVIQINSAKKFQNSIFALKKGDGVWEMIEYQTDATNPPAGSNPPDPVIATYIDGIGGKAIGGLVLEEGWLIITSVAIYRCNMSGRIIKQWVAEGATIEDYSCSRSQEILAISTTKELIAFDLNLQVLWRKTSPGSGSRVDICETMGVIARSQQSPKKLIEVYGKSGGLMAKTELNKTYLTDIAVSLNKVYVCGFSNLKVGNPVQSAFLYAFDLVPGDSELKFEWKLWDFNGETLRETGNLADSRLLRISILPNGRILVAGEAAGGNTMFRYNGRNLNTLTLQSNDLYNNPFNAQSAHQTYYAIVDPLGVVTRGQLSFCRVPPKMTTNTNKLNSICWHKSHIYVGTTAAFAIENRDLTKFMGKLPNPYISSDPTLMKVPDSMQTRTWWFTPPGEKVSGQVVGFDGFGNYLLAVIQPKEGAKIYPSSNATHHTPPSPAAPFVILWRT